MPLEEVVRSTMAVLMLMIALMGSPAFARPTFRLLLRNAEPQVPDREEKVECIVDHVELRDLNLFGTVEEQMVKFRLVPRVRVTKDQKPVGLESLARGDVAVLTLASPGSDVVVRIEAVSSR